jgi:hypothetical protein
LRYGRGTEIGAIMTVGDARQNYTQTYNVSKTMGDTTLVLNNSTLLVPPPNVGKRTTPLYNDANGRAISGAATRATLDPYTQQTTYDLPGGTTVFAGLREDGFYADIPESSISSTHGSSITTATRTMASARTATESTASRVSTFCTTAS